VGVQPCPFYCQFGLDPSQTIGNAVIQFALITEATSQLRAKQQKPSAAGRWQICEMLDQTFPGLSFFPGCTLGS
jgi:hypothetical protein